MKKTLTLSTLALATLALVGLSIPAFAGYGKAKDAAKHSSYEAMVGKPAPGFTLDAATGDGTHSLSDFEDKIVVLHFQSCNCPWDVAYQPQLNAIAEKFEDRGVVFLGINSNKTESGDQIQNYAPQANIPYTILKDPGNKVADQYMAKTTPHMYVIDGEGTLRYVGGIEEVPGGMNQVSQMDTQYLEPVLTALVNGSEPPYTVTKSKGCSIKRVN